MEHRIDIVMQDGDSSWCACSCGWASEKTNEDAAAKLYGAHVAESALIASTTPAS